MCWPPNGFLTCRSGPSQLSTTNTAHPNPSNSHSPYPTPLAAPRDDTLGKMALTNEGILARDRFVLSTCARFRVSEVYLAVGCAD